MGRVSLTSLLVCLWLLEGGCGGWGETLGEPQVEFAISLYQLLSVTDNNSNLIVSPLSVSMSLGLLQFGARGRTQAQLEDALKYNVNDVHARELLLQAQSDVGNSSQTTAVWLACALFIQHGEPLCPAFTQHALLWGNSSIMRTNFSRPNDTRSQVEQWVRNHGNADVLPNQPMWGDSSGWAEPQMTLVSTVAFRGAWQKQFQHVETQSLPFTLADGSVSKVPMMYQAMDVLFGQFQTSLEHRYTVLELPYRGGSVSLLVVLPSDRKVPLSHLEPQLNAHTIATWEAGLRRTKMDVFLPRFKIQSRFDLRSVLPSLGISDIFNPAVADFSGISAKGGLYVSEAIHAAKVEVTEDGTKAGATTAMVLLKRSRAPVFKADRPFLFLLRQASTGSILFMGRMVNPVEQAL